MSKVDELKAKNENLFQKNTILLNENRLLGERCNQLLKDKGNLTDQIADIKANCDLAIESRDIKIKELELELTVEKDQHQEEINLHLHAEDYIKSLEKVNAELKKWQKDTIKARGNDYIDWSRMKEQLTKAKEIIKKLIELVDFLNEDNVKEPIIADAEQFLKEIEK